LHNDRHTGRHGSARVRHSLLINAKAFDYGDIEPLRPEMIDEAMFVAGAAFPKNLQQRVPHVWSCQHTIRYGEIETRQVATIQMTNQIGCAEPDCSVHPFHITNQSDAVAMCR